MRMNPPPPSLIDRLSRAPFWLGVLFFAVAGSTLVFSHDPMGSAAARAPSVSSIPLPTASEYPKGADTSGRLDEARGGRTSLGTPISRRTKECFPAEPRDLFWQMDQVASGPNGELEPLDFDLNGDGVVSDDGEIGTRERDAIRGRNTWLLWGAGNETFWGWLQERGYGLVDFLILMDSRRRDSRFRTAGLINQPGFRENKSRRVLGLYLDEPIEGQSKLEQRNDDFDRKDHLAERPSPPEGHPSQLFEIAADAPGRAMYAEAYEWLARADDGIDPSIYGYPSGIFGLRLMVNPDFFGNTDAAGKARERWRERVMSPTHAGYYNDPNVAADPQLVRPFRISMSCGFCHVGPHPLNPPADVENPAWENLSSIVGGQWWRPQPAFGNLLNQNSFLYHFLASQAPGTIDTSLVSTDHINNTNTINAIYDLPARLARAKENTPELQSPENLLVPSIEDQDRSINPRHFPRVLVDGADSCGGFAAFIRVPLNIGTFSEEWATCHNPIIGFRHQRPFRVSVSQANSVYWQTNEKYRVPYLAAFFTHVNRHHKTTGNDAQGQPVQKQTIQRSTGPMKLLHASDREPGSDGRAVQEPADPSNPTAGNRPKRKPTGLEELKRDTDQTRWRGRTVFIEHCAICHSSKQPPDFRLAFSRTAPEGGWQNAPAPTASGDKAAPSAPHYTLPMDFAHWPQFRRSAAYSDYHGRIRSLAEAGVTPEQMAEGFKLETEEDPFIRDNFLSSEIRIPVSLVGTNSGRATATNAMRGQVWDNFSSEDYKRLPAVGPVRFYNPFSEVTPDEFGNNDEYHPQGGGPGYYRPASLISLWSTAPYLHNNTAGGFNPSRKGDNALNPSTVRARLDAFNDGIRKILWKDKRSMFSLDPAVNFEQTPGDLRATGSLAAQGDPGYIYRLPQDTHVGFAAPFIRPLIEGVTGPGLLRFLSLWIWVILGALWVFAFFKAAPRHAGILLLGLALLVAAVGLLTGVGAVTGTTMGALLAGASGMLAMPAWILWAIVLFLAILGAAFLFGRNPKWLAILFVALVGLDFLALLVLGLAGWLGVAGVPKIPAWLWWPAFWAIVVLGLVVYVNRRNERWATQVLFGMLAAVSFLAPIAINGLLEGRFGALSVGPIPKGTPVNLIMNIDPEKGSDVAKGVVAMIKATVRIKKEGLREEAAYRVFAETAGPALLEASKCPDFVLDRGHWFGEPLTDQEKEDLIAFLKTL